MREGGFAFGFGASGELWFGEDGAGEVLAGGAGWLLRLGLERIWHGMGWGFRFGFCGAQVVYASGAPRLRGGVVKKKRNGCESGTSGGGRSGECLGRRFAHGAGSGCLLGRTFVLGELSGLEGL